MKTLCRIALLSLAALPVSAANADQDVLSVLESSQGMWEGELYYLDYQSGQRFGIPMRIQAEMTPDKATLIRRLTFTDPGNLVHAVNVVTVEKDSGELVEAYFRERRDVELLRFRISRVDYRSADAWTLSYEQEGTDDGRPANIRHTLNRDGKLLTSTKEVRFLDEESDYFLRNGMEVTLQ